jgi:cytochrome c
MRLALALALAAAFAVAAAVPAAAADGQALFNAQCKSCHTVNGTSSPAGPTLKGAVGRRIASASGFTYSAGLKARTGTWTDASLDAYLANPSGFAPGTRMFARVAQSEARAAIIEYLKTLH